MNWRTHYPFQSNYFVVNSHRMHYVDEGPRAADGTMLMVHGNPTWSFYYRKLIRHFRAFRRVIAPDHLGMGLSDKPKQAAYDLQSHTERLSQLVEKLDLQKIHLIVHDWGGPIGLGTALNMPDRFARITITNTAAFPPPYVPWRISICRWPVLGNFLLRQLNVFPRAAIRMATEQKGGLEKSIAAGFLAPYDGWTSRLAISRFVQDIPVRQSDPTWQRLADLESQLPKLGSKPIQLIWGMKDWCFRPACLERLQGLLPAANVIEIANAGHYVNEDALPQVMDAVARFEGALES